MKLAFLWCFALIASAQPAFEVASVKETRVENIEHDGIRFAPGGRFTASSMTLKALIRLAYEVQGYQVLGGPAWLNRDRFDVDAKAERNPDHAQLLAMMQGLLADRFQLRLHREVRELAAYRLVIGKNGPKMPEAVEANGQFRFGPARAEWDAGTMQQLANYLAGQLDRAVVDRTELKGRHQIKLEWEPDPSAPAGTPLFSAVEKLGLKLEADKELIDVLVVETAAKPSAN